jgi:prevent-host-death family protein
MVISLRSGAILWLVRSDGNGNDKISAAEARRKFSQLLRGVRLGRSYVVTIQGTPVARISPSGESRRADDAARTNLLIRLRRQKAVKVSRWVRDELYGIHSK